MGFPFEATTDAEVLSRYSQDWSEIRPSTPCGVALPKSTNEVEEIVRWAAQEKCALVPSGGRTGLSGGAVPLKNELIVSFEKMNQILDFDPGGWIRCQPGVALQVVQDQARENGWYYPVDLAARGSCQIGGNVATNAGGVHVVRWGPTRHWVGALEFVNGSGEAIQCGRALIKDASGPSLKETLIGSEGILGLVTEVTLQLTSPPADTCVVLLGVKDFSSAHSVLRGASGLCAAEIIESNTLEFVKKEMQLQHPLSENYPYYLLLEIEGSPDLDRLVGDGLASDGIISQSSQQKTELWKYRELLTEALSKHQPHKNDLSIPFGNLESFVKGLSSLQAPGLEIYWFGHVGDGNLHINAVSDKANWAEFDQRLFKIVSDLGGSFSAEHGIGVLKRAYLDRSTPWKEQARSLKQAFDPHGILNPGKVL